MRHAGRCKLRTPTVQRLLLGQPGRARLLTPTAWPPVLQSGDDRYSDARKIKKANCEGPPRRSPVLAGLSPHEDLQRTPSAYQTRPAATNIRQVIDELSKVKQRTCTARNLSGRKARNARGGKPRACPLSYTIGHTPRVQSQTARLTAHSALQARQRIAIHGDGRPAEP